MKKLLLLSMALTLLGIASLFTASWYHDAMAFVASAAKSDFSMFLAAGAIAIAAALVESIGHAKAWAHARLRIQRSVLSQGSTQCDAPGMVGFGSIHARC